MARNGQGQSERVWHRALPAAGHASRAAPEQRGPASESTRGARSEARLQQALSRRNGHPQAPPVADASGPGPDEAVKVPGLAEVEASGGGEAGAGDGPAPSQANGSGVDCPRKMRDLSPGDWQRAPGGPADASQRPAEDAPPKRSSAPARRPGPAPRGRPWRGPGSGETGVGELRKAASTRPEDLRTAPGGRPASSMCHREMPPAPPSEPARPGGGPPMET